MIVWRVVAACALAAVAAWAGARLYTARHAPALAERGIAVPAGEASAPTFSDLDTAGGVPMPVKIPELLPAFTLADRHGRATSIESWPGKSLVINFWATWCAPCRREIPLLKSVAADWSGRDFQVIGIAVDYPDKVESFARQFAIPYPLLVGEQDALDAAAALGVESPAFPFTVFTDHAGRVVALYLGELHPPQATLILSVVQQINQGKVDMAGGQHLIAAGLAQLQIHPEG
jgi:thiol-disulfide isomerase/thioredoxin